MSTKRAKILDEKDIQRVLAYVDVYDICPESARTKVLFSFRAGLRVSEIANITIDAVTTAEGKISKTINLFSHMTKYGKERQIPMHPEIAQAIKVFRQAYPEARKFALGRNGAYQNVQALTVWFHNLYKRLGYEGCSSHSGRRTCLTTLARQLAATGGSLRDVQAIAGHARLDTTQGYIEPSSDLSAMIARLGDPRLAQTGTSEFQDRHMRKISDHTASLMTRRRSSAPLKRDHDFSFPRRNRNKGGHQ